MSVYEKLPVNIDPAIAARPSIDAPKLCERCNKTIFSPVNWSHLRGETLSRATPEDEDADYHIDCASTFVLKRFMDEPLPRKRGPVVNIQVAARDILRSCAESCTFCMLLSLLDVNGSILSEGEQKAEILMQAFWPQKSHGVVHPLFLAVRLGTSFATSGAGPMLPIALIDEQSALDCTEVASGPTEARESTSEHDFWQLIDQVGAWLVNCESSHTECAVAQSQTPVVPPTRLLDLACLFRQGKIKLVKLTEILEDQYAMLSYVWGVSTVLRLTEVAEADIMAGIALDDLPRTIQEAVFITIQLRIRYLWVDSLCILQDSETDKGREIVSMAEYYRNATVVISASGAEDVNAGFIDHQTFARQRYDSVKYPELYGPGILGSIPLRIPVHLPETSAVWLGDIRPPLYSYRGEPINKRAWTLQESILPRRLISFPLSGGIAMQCLQGEVVAGEIMSNPFDEMPEYASLGSVALSRQTGQDPSQLWFDLVQDYTQRSLTYQSDILVAISALAREFHDNHQATLLRYMAGLWMGHLREGLLWFTKSELKTPTIGHYHAPSWSWASCAGLVRFRNKAEMYLPRPNADDKWRRMFTPRWYCEVLECQTTPVSKLDLFGAVSAGYLTIRGPLRRVRPEGAENDNRPGESAQPSPEVQNKEDLKDYKAGLTWDSKAITDTNTSKLYREPVWSGSKPEKLFLDTMSHLDWSADHLYYWLGIWYAGRGRARGLIVEQISDNDFRRVGFAEYMVNTDAFPASDLHLERIIRLI